MLPRKLITIAPYPTVVSSNGYPLKKMSKHTAKNKDDSFQPNTFHLSLMFAYLFLGIQSKLHLSSPLFVYKQRQKGLYRCPHISHPKLTYKPSRMSSGTWEKTEENFKRKNEINLRRSSSVRDLFLQRRLVRHRSADRRPELFIQ